MEKERILEAAQKNKSMGSEYENKINDKTAITGIGSACVVGGIIFLIEYFAKGTWNIGVLVTVIGAICASSFYKGIKLKRTKFLILGSIAAVCTVFLLLVFVIQVVS